MIQLLDVFGFLSVVLRGLTLALQSMVIGGLVFDLFVARGDAGASAARACRGLLAASALVLALAQAGYLAADTAILMGTADLSLAAVAGANFFVAGVIATALALAVAALAWWTARPDRDSGVSAGRQLRDPDLRDPDLRPLSPDLRGLPHGPGLAGAHLRHRAGRRPVLAAALLLSLGILGAAVATSHAAARLEGRALLLALTSLHVAAIACWVGGLPYLLLALARVPDTAASRTVASRFSRLAQGSVAVLLAAGVGLAVIYVGSPAAILGSAYGAMVSAKAILLALLLGLGALNYYVVRRAEAGDASGLAGPRRFAQAEVGIGLTLILSAPSLTSQPPAPHLAAPDP